MKARTSRQNYDVSKKASPAFIVERLLDGYQPEGSLMAYDRRMIRKNLAEISAMYSQNPELLLAIGEAKLKTQREQLSFYIKNYANTAERSAEFKLSAAYRLERGLKIQEALINYLRKNPKLLTQALEQLATQPEPVDPATEVAGLKPTLQQMALILRRSMKPICKLLSVPSI